MKKKQSLTAQKQKSALKFKLSLVTKNSLILLFFAAVQMQAASGYAQRIKNGISMKESSVEQVLNTIESQSDYLFLYDQESIDTNRIVSVENSEGDITEVLNAIFANTNVTHSIVDKQIILSDGSRSTAQQSSPVKGTIIDDLGEPLIGVNIMIKGTSDGTISDLDGNFTLEVRQGDVLVISYTGYTTQEITIGESRTLNITMLEDSQQLEEVVVTALGIKRQTKSLTYNVQELKAADITGVKDANFVNGLAGKIAGVTINQSSTGIGGSSRVIMRGTKSLFGDNNALYVVDGIPMSQMKSSQTTSLYESPDGGDSDGISNLNPDDIETISVLTGAAAAALYGTQGANGVILITTKKGTEGRLTVNYSNDTQFMSPFVMPEFQNTYGSVEGSYSSWGSKLETPSSYRPKDFFQTGYSESNSISLSAGTNRNQTYFSAAATNARGIIPNNDYNRYNFTLRNTAELVSDKLTLDMSASYILSDNNNMLGQGQYHNPLVPIYLFPRGDDMAKYKVYERYNAERNFKTQFWPYGVQDLAMENPYWIVNRENMGNEKQRYMFTANLLFKINDYLSATGRLRVDNSQDTYTRKISASSSTLFASENGNYLNQKTEFKNTYGDVILTFNKQFGKWGLNSNLGASFNDQVNSVTGYEGHLFTVPNLFTFANINQSGADTRPIQSGYHENSQAVFATAQVSYGSMLFLDITGRNDWYSSLAFTDNEKSGFFYPSVGLSAVFTEMFDLSKAGISFLKVRASYSEVGNAPLRFRTSTTYSINSGVLETRPNVPPTFLKPERTKSFEIGANVRLFRDLINLDLTYYNANTFNQFFTFTMPPSSGFNEFYINGGKVNNWGIEASLGVKTNFGPVNWSSNLTFTMNRNEIKELLPEDARNPLTGELMGVNEIEPFNPQGTYKMILKQGGTMNDIYVSGLVTDSHGNIKVDPQTGFVSPEPNVWLKAGSTAPRFNWGWNNTFSYKGVSLGFLLDARIGGVGVSATQALMDRYGVSKSSAEARDNGGALVNGGRVNAENFYAITGGGTTGVLSQYVYSMTNVRLREVTLGYTLPKRWFDNKIEKLTVSFIGKNLIMFRNKAPFDPEITASTGTYYQGIDYFMQPSLRSIGFSLKLQY